MKHTDMQASAQTYHFIIPHTQEKLRLDIFITQQLPQYSRNFLQKLIEQKHITINGKQTKSSATIKTGDTVAVCIPETQPMYVPNPPPEVLEKINNLAIEIVYEHQDFFILAKPAGLTVHKPSRTSTEISLVDWLIHKLPSLAQIGHPERPGIVHRLDKDTSGLIIIPRTPHAYMLFGAMFKNRTIQKTYHALVEGHPEKEGTIDVPIGRDPIFRNKMSTHGIGARNSITHYKLLASFKNASLLEVYPRTGRTHQIRVHLAYLGYPIIGDTTYGTSSKLIDRQALHAYGLSFSCGQELISVYRDEPEDFKALLETLKN